MQSVILNLIYKEIHAGEVRDYKCFLIPYLFVQKICIIRKIFTTFTNIMLKSI